MRTAEGSFLRRKSKKKQGKEKNTSRMRIYVFSSLKGYIQSLYNYFNILTEIPDEKCNAIKSGCLLVDDVA
jgi:hypothetical protein